VRASHSLVKVETKTKRGGPLLALFEKGFAQGTLANASVPTQSIQTICAEEDAASRKAWRRGASRPVFGGRILRFVAGGIGVLRLRRIMRFARDRSSLRMTRRGRVEKAGRALVGLSWLACGRLAWTLWLRLSAWTRTPVSPLTERRGDEGGCWESRFSKSARGGALPLFRGEVQRQPALYFVGNVVHPREMFVSPLGSS
jgi:hypothetical protein